MNNLQIFENAEFGKVRVSIQNEEPWFVAKDICEVLQIKNTTDALKRLDNDEVARLNLGGLSGETNIVNEYGLYSLVLGSRKPEAKSFKRWITHEVIPSIRKHGAYMTEETIKQALTTPDFIIELATKLKQEQEEKARALAIIKAQEPQVIFANALITSEDSCLVGQLAKILRQNGIDIGQNRLFEDLRSRGYLCKAGENHNMPTQKSMDLGLMEIKQRTINNPDGSVRVTKTPKVTAKGQMYFINRYLVRQSA